MDASDDHTLVGMLQTRADTIGDRVAFTRFADDPRHERQITYADLDARARTIAAALRARGLDGQRVLLLLAPGLDYIAAFFGALYAGAVAVPCYPPPGASLDAAGAQAARHSRGLAKVQAVARAARPGAVLTQAMPAQRTALLSQVLGGLPILSLDAVLQEGDIRSWQMPAIGSGSLAYLQFTSGSTGSPRGVMITHENLLANLAAIQRSFTLHEGSVVASWLPPYHDMGLIGGILEPIFCRGRGIQLTPTEFLQRPGRWLDAIERHRADTGGAPNFAYELCVRRVSRERRETLDLSTWTLAFCGAEPIRADTIRRFVEAFGPCGFRRAAFFPCYGLAEATLAVTTSRRLRGPKVITLDRETFGQHRAVSIADGDGKEVVGCGTTIDDVRVCVVDATTGQQLPAGHIGEIWVAGRSVASGYWEVPDATERTFGARLPGDDGPFLRTGDVGFVDDEGELHVVGRTRDIIIVRGVNHYPTDIEATVEPTHMAIRTAGVAAFGVHTADGERVVVAVELDPRSGAGRDGHHDEAALAAIAGVVRAAVVEGHELEPLAILLISAGSLPKTSSGKVERYACRERFLERSFPILYEWRAPDAGLPTRRAHRAPQSPIERELAAIWADVLDTAEPSLDDDFFDAGGHSLLAIELVERIAAALRVELPLSDLIEHSTLEALARHVATCPERPAPIAVAGAAGSEVRHAFPLTAVQEAYLFGRSPAFELGGVATQAVIEFDAAHVDSSRLARALDALIQRHEMLRAIVTGNGQQVVLETVPDFPLERHDLSDLAEAEREHTIGDIRRRLEESMRPPDRWPLFDVVVCHVPEGRTRVLVRFDLLIADLHSLRMLWRQLGALYADPGASPHVPPLTFRDCVLHERALQSGPDWERSANYWQQRAPLLPPAPELPFTSTFSAIGTPRFRRRTRGLAAEQWARVQTLARQHHLTPAAVVLAAFSAVLAAWSRHPRFTLTLTFFNRPRLTEVEHVVGDFTSLLLVALDAATSPTFSGLADHVQRELWESLAFRRAGGVHAIREVARRQGRTGHAVMPVVFTCAIGDGLEERTAPWAWLGDIVGGSSSTPQVVLDHQVQEDGDRLLLTWDAVDDLFPPGVLDEMFAAYGRVLDWVSADGAAWTQNMPVLTPGDQLARVEIANGTTMPLADGTLHGLFLAQAARQPERPAVICADGTILSYAVVEQRSRAVAEAVLRSRPDTESLVGVMLAKGWEQVVAVLGVLRAGAAYLPIDPSLPRERRAHLCERGRVRVALTSAALAAELDWPNGVQPIHVDAVPPASDETGWQEVGDPSRTAYVIFTSGSTGAPKGVVIDHRGAVNTIVDLNDRFGVGAADRVFAISGLGFDLSVYDIFGTLAAGGTVVMPAPGTERDPAHWAELAHRYGVTIWNSVPALFEMLCEYADRSGPGLPPSLRLAWLSGDWLPVALPERARRLRPRLRVVSMGGATEASIWSVIYPIEDVKAEWRSIPYGRPMRNQQMHVLDHALQPRPAWVAGELYIGGTGVALGYWQDVERTAASFVRREEARLYKTGDIARWLPDGNLEFLGREDGQVKIGGLRIELGEIEAAIRSHGSVRAAVVVPQHVDVTAQRDRSAASKRQLVAYVVPADPTRFSETALLERLAATLPSGLMPRRIVLVDELPLSANGKVDVAKLPAAWPSGRAIESPATADEELVLGIWAEVLGVGVDAIGPTDNFFDVGGSSVTLVQVAGMVAEKAGRAIPVLTFFEHPTVRAMARLLGDPVSGTDTDESLHSETAVRASQRRRRLAVRRKSAGAIDR